MAFTVFHSLELQTVGIKKEHCIVVVVIFSSSIYNLYTLFPRSKRLQSVHVLPATKLKSVVMETDITNAIPSLPALCIRRPDPEAGLAVRPANRIVIFIRNFEPQKCE